MSPRKPYAIRRETHMPDEPKPPPQKRPCLRCERTFMSRAADNRLCQPCRKVLQDDGSPAHVYRFKGAAKVRRWRTTD